MNDNENEKETSPKMKTLKAIKQQKIVENAFQTLLDFVSERIIKTQKANYTAVFHELSQAKRHLENLESED